MDDSRPHRRKSLKNLLFGELSVGRRFDSAQRNFLFWKSSKISRRCSSFRGDNDIIRSGMESVTDLWGACSEETSSQGSCLRKSWKGSFSRSLCWIKWNFLSSSSLRNYHASRPAPLKNSCSLAAIPKHEVSNILCPKIEPSVETEDQREIFEMIKSEANEGKDCDYVNENEVKDCDDVSKKEGLCCEPSSECRGSFCEEEQYGNGDDVEERCDTEDECDVEEGHGHNKGGPRKKLVRNYPPPLPSLARTGNLPCHMPWVHLRSYKTDGRLVIKEVKVQHHEFFRAQRSNGRLILHLVQHDEDKVRAGLFKAEAEETIIDPVEEDIDRREESKEIGTKEEGDEAENVHNEETNAGGDLEGAEKQNGDTDGEGAKKRIGGKVEKLSCDTGLDELLPSFRSIERERLIPDSLQMQTHRFSGSHLQANSSAVGYGSKGLESPVGCCSPISNPFFDRPISTIRPILS